jgi:hypothetical protein
MGRGENFLQHILGVLLGLQHRATEGEQPTVVAVEECLEGPIVARSDQGDKALVALKAENG